MPGGDIGSSSSGPALGSLAAQNTQASSAQAFDQSLANVAPTSSPLIASDVFPAAATQGPNSESTLLITSIRQSGAQTAAFSGDSVAPGAANPSRLGPFGALLQAGVAPDLAMAAHVQWETAWLGTDGPDGLEPVWQRWGLDSAGDLLDLLALRGVNTCAISDGLTLPRRSGIMRGTADDGIDRELPATMRPERSIASTAPSVSEATALGLMRPDGRLGGIGAGGLAAWSPGSGLSEGAHGLISFPTTHGSTTTLVILEPAPLLQRQHATSAFTATIDRIGTRSIVQLAWSAAIASILDGESGDAIAASFQTATRSFLRDGERSVFNITMPLVPPAMVFPGTTATISPRRADHRGVVREQLAIRPRWRDDADNDMLTGALGSHVVLRIERQVRIDVADPAIKVMQADEIEILVSIETAGLNAAQARAADLAEQIEAFADPVSLLGQGEAFRARYGSPLWLRLLGIEKPDNVGYLPLASDPPRFGVVHARNGTWLVGHRRGHSDPGWRTEFPATACDEAAFWLDLCYGLPGSASAIPQAVSTQFTMARAAGEWALQRQADLHRARQAEAWSAMALDIALNFAANNNHSATLIDPALLSALARGPSRPETAILSAVPAAAAARGITEARKSIDICLGGRVDPISAAARLGQCGAALLDGMRAGLTVQLGRPETIAISAALGLFAVPVRRFDAQH
jgi:hypothetical protein